MDRDLAIEVISDTTYFPVFQNYCSGSCYADEHYLPTFERLRVGVNESLEMREVEEEERENHMDVLFVNKPCESGLNQPYDDGNKPTGLSGVVKKYLVTTMLLATHPAKKKQGERAVLGGIRHVKNLVTVGTGLVGAMEMLATLVERLITFPGNVLWVLTADGLAISHRSDGNSTTKYNV
ncbi:hypothetical protein POM88_027608 [Heracleum sosnowskyi]|uniref:Uncharacterized protein n=1 Tax=Heracleum sosnowskyi TaxID=360622 RepID=A0AAD8I9B6_9APIA|nr:hypothetical protein POM88_027608 [Heracleum sosnowskyi]